MFKKEYVPFNVFKGVKSYLFKQQFIYGFVIVAFDYPKLIQFNGFRKVILTESCFENIKLFKIRLANLLLLYNRITVFIMRALLSNR